MKIANSAVALSASHESLSVQQRSMIFGLRVNKDDWEAKQKDDDPKQQNNSPDEKNEQQAAIVNLSDKGREQLQVQSANQLMPAEENSSVPSKTMSTLRALLHYLKTISTNPKAYERLEEMLDKQDAMAAAANKTANPIQPRSFILSGNGKNSGNQTVSVNRIQTFSAESEYTSFSAQGLAKTEDGREISFNVDFEMSREFMQYTQVDEMIPHQETHQILCDPLVINVGRGTTAVSDQKFTFDLDADGNDDFISLLKDGSGFLALDKDENGKIDDGSELFGTKSGDGFRDLAAYDGDGNGWIDENDDVFSKLKIWFKDEDGTDRLMDLKSADVGAIYLGNASTEFSLKNDAQATNGVIRSSGIFLRESGGAGTVQHLDLAL